MTLAPRPEFAAGAKRFGAALANEIELQGASRSRLCRSLGLSWSAMTKYCCGQILPSLDVGRALAGALGSDDLAELIVKCRTVKCPVCRKPYVHDGRGGRQRYCGTGCRRIAGVKRSGTDSRTRAATVETLLDEVQSAMAEHRAAVLAMCRSCEPAGICRVPSCPLRAVSPFVAAERRAS